MSSDVKWCSIFLPQSQAIPLSLAHKAAEDNSRQALQATWYDAEVLYSSWPRCVSDAKAMAVIDDCIMGKICIFRWLSKWFKKVQRGTKNPTGEADPWIFDDFWSAAFSLYLTLSPAGTSDLHPKPWRLSLSVELDRAWREAADPLRRSNVVSQHCVTARFSARESLNPRHGGKARTNMNKPSSILPLVLWTIKIWVVYYCFTTIELVISWLYIYIYQIWKHRPTDFYSSGRRQPCIVQEQNAAVCLPRCSAWNVNWRWVEH